MKTKPLQLLTLSLLVAASPLAHGGQETKTMHVVVDSEDGTIVRELIKSKEAEAEAIAKAELKYHLEKSMQPRPFLGVETTKIGPTLGKQLGLASGVGLAVARVVPGTGAAEVLEDHDLMIKFDDQLLVSSDQLGVLIQSKEPGDEVALTILRSGKEKVVTAALSERKGKAVKFKGDSMKLPESLSMNREELKSMIEEIKAEAQGMFSGELDEVAPSIRVTNINQGSIVFTDDKGTVTLTSAGGAKTLVVIDESGEHLFQGPVDTDEQREKLSDEVFDRLEKIESLEALDLIDGDFKVEEEVRVMAPHASNDVRAVRIVGDRQG